MVWEDVPRCPLNSPSQHAHPPTASTPITTNNAVSVVRRTSSILLLCRYFCLASRASSSVTTPSPRLLLFFSAKYSSLYLRPSSSICVGVSSGLRAPSLNPLCGRNGGGGSAFTNVYASSSASVPLSLGDCDCDGTFLRLRPFRELCRVAGTERSVRISSLWRK
jgi:hypothetical protein